MYTYDYFEDEDDEEEEEIIQSKSEKEQYIEAREWLENQKV
jgi:hypothetical protein